MKSKNPSHRQNFSSCNELGPDDGVDPRTFFRKPSRKGINRKALQLCGQIARTLSSVLAWECGDDLLRNLSVESVEPAPDSTRVLVTVCLQALPNSASPSQVLERLHRFTGKFRSEIAAAIHRKRVPELVFRIAGPQEVNS